LNSWKAKISNSVQTYQLFIDRNIALKNREDELLNTISELEAKQTELQKTLAGLKQQVSEFQDINADNTDLNRDVKLEDIVPTNDASIQRSNMANNHQNENNELHHFHPKVEPSSRT
jgi:chromosome segregation ATPase